MYEQPEDLTRLQSVLDASYERAGAHLRTVFVARKRISAEELPELLPGVQILSLATVTAAGEPRVAPVDGLFFRGAFWFGSDPNSARFRHIRHRPAVSADHIRGEELAILVHGTAQVIDHNAPEHAAFRAYCVETYGEKWLEFGPPAMYARIEAKAMFAHTLGNWEE